MSGDTRTIVVHGTPAPQGSKRHVGGGRMIESSAKVGPWREAVKAAALAERGAKPPFAGPVVVTAVFLLPAPKSLPKRRFSHPSKRPDLDKLLRSTMDALTDVGVFLDDAQVVNIVAVKQYAGMDGKTTHPGAVITVSPAPPDGYSLEASA